MIFWLLSYIYIYTLIWVFMIVIPMPVNINIVFHEILLKHWATSVCRHGDSSIIQCVRDKAISLTQLQLYQLHNGATKYLLNVSYFIVLAFPRVIEKAINSYCKYHLQLFVQTDVLNFNWSNAYLYFILKYIYIARLNVNSIYNWELRHLMKQTRTQQHQAHIGTGYD